MKKAVLSCLFVLAVLAFASCGGDDTDSSATTGPNVFFTAVKNTAPVFQPTATKAVNAWEHGNPVYEIFNMLRDYNPDTDVGAVGIENIYKLMYQAGSFFDECEGQGESIADTTMTSPFDTGRTPQAYNKILVVETSDRTNYFATRREGTVNSGLLCWYIDRGTSKEYGILEGNYNETTHEIDVDLISFVEYGTAGAAGHSIGSLRTHLAGNAETHTFTDLRLGRWSIGDDDNDAGTAEKNGYCSWYIATGAAQGTGQFSLFLVSDNSPGGLTDRYFDIPADTTEAYLSNPANIDPAGYPGTPLADYKTIVDDHRYTIGDYFDVLIVDPVDVVTDVADFTGTGSGNLKPVGMP